LKKQGVPFFPDVIFKDSIAILMAFLIVLFLAAFVGAPLGRQADPTGSSYAPRPEWYFLFLFELLKYFPGHLEFVGILVIPTVFLLILFFLPFLDRNPRRHYRHRPVALGLATIVAASVVFLGVRGALSEAPPVTTAAGPLEFGRRLTPFEREGLRVYQENRCFVCHQINGSGGAIGPDLSTVGLRLDAAWVVRHLESPRSLAPGTTMPQFTLSNQDLMALTAFLLTLRVRQAPAGPVEGPLSPSAQNGKQLFTTNCNACHPGGAQGIGPRLYGTDFARRYPQDSDLATLIRTGKGNMPGYSEAQLSDAQLQDLIAYLRALKEPPKSK